MELETLEKKRDAYAGKMVHLMIYIGLIFLIPALIAILIAWLIGVSSFTLFPVAFVLSWTLVVLLYRKYNREVKELDRQIALCKEKSINK